MSQDTDNNYLSIADTSGVHLEDKVINPANEGLNPADFDDLLKFSRASFCSATLCDVDGQGQQKENAIDMNRLCEDIAIDRCRLVSGKQNAITIKGGCARIFVNDTIIVPGTGNCDVELGGWSDQSREKVTQVTLSNLTRTDGKPVRLRVGHADYPIILGGNVKYMWFESLVLKAWWFLRSLFP